MTKGEKMALWAAEQVGQPYVFASAGMACTPKNRRAKAKKKPEYADKISAYCPVLSGKRSSCDGCKYQGEKAYDCRGLIYQAAKAAGLTISSIGSSSQWRGDYWQKKGLISDMPTDRPCVIFRQDDDDPDVMSHVGMHMGGGIEVDARGHRDGVVRKDMGDYPWTHYGILRGADDDYVEPEPVKPLLRRGSKGDTVRELQLALIARGYDVGEKGADGIFGSATQLAVKAIQIVHDLKADGVVGPLTWAVLEDRDVQEDRSCSVIISGISAADATALLEAWGERARLADVDKKTQG